MEYDAFLYTNTGEPVPPEYPDIILVVCSLLILLIPVVIR